jgi:hypothetical protein
VSIPQHPSILVTIEMKAKNGSFVAGRLSAQAKAVVMSMLLLP